MRIISWAAFAILISCTGKEKPPKGIIGEKEMASVLTDIHLAEARVSNMGMKSLDSSVLVFDQLQKEVWKKYQLDTARYNLSYKYYVSNPETLSRIYEMVTENLEKADTLRNNTNQESKKE